MLEGDVDWEDIVIDVCRKRVPVVKLFFRCLLYLLKS